MDEMIDKLAAAAPYELPAAVKRAFRIIRSPPFFLRIAERTDQATTDEEREKLQALATNLVSTLEVVVETTEEQLDERAVDVETVVKAAAEPDEQCTLCTDDDRLLAEAPKDTRNLAAAAGPDEQCTLCTDDDRLLVEAPNAEANKNAGRKLADSAGPDAQCTLCTDDDRLLAEAPVASNGMKKNGN